MVVNDNARDLGKLTPIEFEAINTAADAACEPASWVTTIPSAFPGVRPSSGLRSTATQTPRPTDGQAFSRATVERVSSRRLA